MPWFLMSSKSQQLPPELWSHLKDLVFFGNLFFISLQILLMTTMLYVPNLAGAAVKVVVRHQPAHQLGEAVT